MLYPVGVIPEDGASQLAAIVPAGSSAKTKFSGDPDGVFDIKLISANSKIFSIEPVTDVTFTSYSIPGARGNPRIVFAVYWVVGADTVVSKT